MCGDTDFVKQDGLFVCQSCGCKYSLEDAVKLMVEGSVDVSGSTIKVDNTAKLDNLYILARRAREEGNIENAQKYYEMIATEEPNDWEAAFYYVYFTACCCKIGEIVTAARSVKNCLNSVCELITINLPSEYWKSAYEVIYVDVVNLASDLLYTSEKHYNEFNNVSGAFNEQFNRVSAILNMVEVMGDVINAIFQDEKKSVNAYYKCLQFIDDYHDFVELNRKNRIYKKIVDLDSSSTDIIQNKKIDDQVAKISREIKILEQNTEGSHGVKRISFGIFMFLVCLFDICIAPNGVIVVMSLLAAILPGFCLVSGIKDYTKYKKNMDILGNKRHQMEALLNSKK